MGLFRLLHKISTTKTSNVHYSKWTGSRSIGDRMLSRPLAHGVLCWRTPATVCAKQTAGDAKSSSGGGRITTTQSRAHSTQRRTLTQCWRNTRSAGISEATARTASAAARRRHRQWQWRAEQAARLRRRHRRAVSPLSAVNHVELNGFYSPLM